MGSHSQSRSGEAVCFDQQRAAVFGDAEGDHFLRESSRVVQQMRTAPQGAFEGLGFAPAHKICDFVTPVKAVNAAQADSAKISAHPIELAQSPALARERRERADDARDEQNLIAKFRRLHEELRKRAEIVFETRGTLPEQAIPAAVKKNAITFIGETHTIDDQVNPGREMLAKVMPDLPKGSRLAIELPSVLQPVFDQFNNSAKGSELVIPEKLEGKYGQQALALLQAIKERSPDIVRVWKAARDAGIKVVPINNDWSLMPPDDPNRPAAIAARDQHMKDKLMDLYEKDKSTPIVAWLGSLHGALRGPSSRKGAAQLLDEDDQFKKNGGTITSFHTQIAEEGADLTLHPLTDKFKKPVSAPTWTGGEANALGVMSLFENPLTNVHRLADWDNVIVYPRAKANGRPAKDPVSRTAPEIGRS